MLIDHKNSNLDLDNNNFNEGIYLEDVILDKLSRMDIRELQIDIVLGTFNNQEFSAKVIEKIFQFVDMDFEEFHNQMTKYETTDRFDNEQLSKINKLLKEQRLEICKKITEFFVFNLPNVYLKNLVSKDKYKFINDLETDEINIREEIISELNRDIQVLVNSVKSFETIGSNLVAKKQKDDYSLVQEKLNRRTYKLINQYYVIISIIDEIPYDSIKKLINAYMESIGDRL